MSRRMLCVLIAVTVPFSVGASAFASSAPANGSQSESGNPINDQGSSYHYRTYITSVTPRMSGLRVEVLEFADRLLLRNNTGKTVTIYGYSGEPYARIKPDGTTEQNVHSPAVYLNTNFYANVTVPPSANATSQPKWVVIDRTGQLEWHDHRIHWMSPAKPPEVTDEGKRTRIFAWSVPIQVGIQPGKIDGELYWVPQSSKAPVAAIVALLVIVLLGALTVIAVRRRRAISPSPDVGVESDDGEAPAGKEAW
jgi:hypothetical protein